jgi:type IV fimbrial biogenesis protein FimT
MQTQQEKATLTQQDVSPDRLATRRADPGFTLAELIVLIAVIGILSIMAMPSFLRYYQAATLKSGAQQFAALINQAREIAIKENDNLCVKVSSPTQMMYVRNNCTTGTAWIGAATDAAGNINLPPRISVAGPSAANSPIFNYVGSALPAATFTLTNIETGATLTVSVAASGRVTIP